MVAHDPAPTPRRRTSPKAAVGRRYRGLSAEERRADQRRRLVRAAIDEFATRGYHRTSVEDIVRSARTSRTAFYAFFDNREDAMYGALQTCLRSVLDTVRETLANASPDDRVTEVGLRAYVDCLVADPAAARIMLLEGVGTSAEVNALRSRIRREIADLIQRALGRIRPRGGEWSARRGDRRRRVRHSLRVDGPPGRVGPARRGSLPRAGALHRGGTSLRPRAGRVKLGIVTPVLTLLPRAHAHWEETATMHDVVTIVTAADRLGYHHCTCSEHVGVPVEIAAVRGGRYYDPLPTFGVLAAHTQRIRFAAHVLVLGYHHPLAIAKRYGTLDDVSGGRVILGVGVGSLREEFELLGAPFEDRGARADDAMRALRAALSQREPEYHGDYYDFAGFLIEPCAVQARVPLWVGGRTMRSLRRAVELGDGWAPFGLRTAELRGNARPCRRAGRL